MVEAHCTDRGALSHHRADELWQQCLRWCTAIVYIYMYMYIYIYIYIYKYTYICTSVGHVEPPLFSASSFMVEAHCTDRGALSHHRADEAWQQCLRWCTAIV